MEKSPKLECYVEVTGEASDQEDQGVQGFYQIDVTMGRPVDPDNLTDAEQSEIAKAVLDSFHEHQGISMLEDFGIEVFASNGIGLSEEDMTTDTNLVLNVEYLGSVDEVDVPFELAGDVDDVVDDVLERAEKYGFKPDEDMVRGAVEESAGLLNITLTEEQIVRACERVMNPDIPEPDREHG